MAEQPELIPEPQPDATPGVDSDLLPDLLTEGQPETAADNAPELDLGAGEPGLSMDSITTETAPLPAPSDAVTAAPAPADATATMPPAAITPAPEIAMPLPQDAGPDVLEALAQVGRAFVRLVDVLPDWAGMFIAAGLAAAIGILVGWRLSRRDAPGAHDPATDTAAPTVRAALPAPENPAFKNYQVFLETKGVSAKERDTQMRAFSERYREMRQNLRDLNPGNKELEDQVELVRDALDAGDFDRVYGLLTRIGNRENTDGTEKRHAALKHLMAAAVAKSVAGDLQMSRLDYESAADNFRQAVEALPPFQDDMHAEILNKYGTASYQAGHHETAIAAFERALQILEKRLGKNHPDVATALNNLALLHYSRGNYDAAEPLYKRSLAIDEQTLGVDHTGVATDLNNLALLYKKKGNLEEAEPLLRRAMEIKEKNFDPGHPSLVTGLKNYASLLRSLGRAEEADIYERRATVLPPSRTGLAAE